tara:strand:+ start:786 stop:1526 length:741 start_codon:yes stop_codon:yes gene_type:complete
MFSHMPAPILRKLDRHQVAGFRFYQIDGNMYPSITSILSIQSNEKLERWKERVGKDVASYAARMGAIRGTAFHEICTDYLNNMDISKHRNKILAMGLFNLVKSEIDRIGDIRVMETPMFSHKFGIAGQVDCIGTFDGVLSVIDFKSATRSKTPDILLNHYIQETAYSLMWRETTSEMIKQIVTIVSCENGETQVSIQEPINYVNELTRCIREFYEHAERNKLSCKTGQFPGIIYQKAQKYAGKKNE